MITVLIGRIKPINRPIVWKFPGLTSVQALYSDDVLSLELPYVTHADA